MASLKVMQCYANKCADKLDIDCKPVLRWQTPDCKLSKHTYAHCHTIDANYPQGTICLSRRWIPKMTTKQWHHTIGHEVAHLAVKSSHSTATFAKRMVQLGVANINEQRKVKASHKHRHIYNGIWYHPNGNIYDYCAICGKTRQQIN